MINIRPRIPTTPTGISVRDREAVPLSRRAPTTSQPIWPIALLGSAIALLASIVCGSAFYFEARATDEYAGFIVLAGIVVGAIATVPGALLAALGAWTFQWRSVRAMWIGGFVAAVAAPMVVFAALMVA